LESGCRRLTDVIYCCPHRAKFAKPIFITLPLPGRVFGKIKVLYTPTDIKEPPTWRDMSDTGGVLNENGCIIFREKHSNNGNQASVVPDRSEVTLMLYHFCAFVICEDEREVTVRDVTITVFLKFNADRDTSFVNLLVLMYCECSKCDETDLNNDRRPITTLVRCFDWHSFTKYLPL
jgi:hypothetical protein